MSDQQMRDTIRQMLQDWDAATDEQRADALRAAKAAADAAEAALVGRLAIRVLCAERTTRKVGR